MTWLWAEPRLKILIAPDSFKGTLSAQAAAQAMAAGVVRVIPEAILQLLPMADGGEGTLDVVFLAGKCARHFACVTDANGAVRRVPYGLLADGSVLIEVAQVVGLPQAARPVEMRTTQGIGELIRYCLDKGVRRFLIGLGGSSTNEGGVGMLAALGAKFFDSARAAVSPTLQGLASLVRVDFSDLDPRLAECDFTLLADVDIPLCGVDGATAIFGPQKGVQLSDVLAFDARLGRLALVGDSWASRRVSHMPGAGAAGGLGFAFMLLGAQRRSGAQYVAERLGLAQALHGAEWAITGEGRSDAQTLRGKLPLVVAREARRAGVKTTLLSGAIEAGSMPELARDFDACFAVAETEKMRMLAMGEPERYLTERAVAVATWIRSLVRL